MKKKLFKFTVGPLVQTVLIFHDNSSNVVIVNHVEFNGTTLLEHSERVKILFSSEEDLVTHIRHHYNPESALLTL